MKQSTVATGEEEEAIGNEGTSTSSAPWRSPGLLPLLPLVSMDCLLCSPRDDRGKWSELGNLL